MLDWEIQAKDHLGQVCKARTVAWLPPEQTGLGQQKARQLLDNQKLGQCFFQNYVYRASSFSTNDVFLLALGVPHFITLVGRAPLGCSALIALSDVPQRAVKILIAERYSHFCAPGNGRHCTS